MLRGGDIKDGKLLNELPFITDEKNKEYARTILRENDVVIALVGYPGESALVPAGLSGANISRAVGLLRLRDNLRPDYLVCLLNSPDGRKEFLRPSAGSAQLVVNLGALNQLRLPLPPLPEQRAIAEALGNVDALLGALDAAIAKQRDLKQAAMQQLLTGQTRLPGFQGKWEKKKLGTGISDLVAGVSVRSIDVDRQSDSEEYCILKTSAVAGGQFIPSERKPIDPIDRDRARVRIRADSVLVSRMNTPDLVGECGYVWDDHPRTFLPDRLWMINLKQEAGISPRWLAYVLSTPTLRRLLQSSATGTSGSMKNIAKSAFLAIELMFPSSKEQKTIAAILSDMDATLAAFESRRAKTAALKQAMMQELLTGRIRLI
jgi:restriction endonuclease S subunit